MQILSHFFKPYAVCYWAQAAIAGAIKFQREHHINTADIMGIRVYTFHESARLAMRYPIHTDEAQYSLPFPVAGALVHGKLYLDELQGDNLHHPEVLRLSGLVELIEDDYFNERFPEQRLSRVVMTTRDGSRYDSGVTWPLWDLREPATDADLRGKFRSLAHQYLTSNRADTIERAVWAVDEFEDVGEFVELLVER